MRVLHLRRGFLASLNAYTLPNSAARAAVHRVVRELDRAEVLPDRERDVVKSIPPTQLCYCRAVVGTSLEVCYSVTADLPDLYIWGVRPRS